MSDDPFVVTHRATVRGHDIEVEVDHYFGTVVAGRYGRMVVFPGRPRSWGDVGKAHAMVGVGDGREWESERFDDPAELRVLIAELSVLADVLEAVESGEWVPPAAPPSLQLEPKREPRQPLYTISRFPGAVKTVTPSE